jgi:hypothetical protein
VTAVTIEVAMGLLEEVLHPWEGGWRRRRGMES